MALYAWGLSVASSKGVWSARSINLRIWAPASAAVVAARVAG
jgi:hypothetical protein